nr:indole-3-glycerol-phosphate synthase [Desulfohalovibrio reitneri]
MLERFRRAKLAEIETLRRADEAGTLPGFWDGVRPSFSRALTQSPLRPALIAEHKASSPSRGVIRPGSNPEDIARAYARAGAAALSVLTEEEHFQGELGHLGRCRPAGLPMLRKDFLFHELQIRRTAATPASALLFIARMLEGPEQLARFLALAGAAGLEGVVEIFDEADLETAREAGSRIIQVNCRDLDTLELDPGRHEALLDKAGGKSGGEVWIAASGVNSPGDMARLADAGYDAALVGTSLMAADDPETAARELLSGARRMNKEEA